MRSVKLLLALAAYYLGATAIIALAISVFPTFIDYLPIGGAQTLLSGTGVDPSDPFGGTEIRTRAASNLLESVIWLFMAVMGALYVILPVSWVYMECRNRDGYNQSLVETIIVLPVAVTAIVVIVQNSLALAFSLAGIVGGVRFRNTLKSSGDALYILVAIGVGLSAGIGALEIGIVMTSVFNFLFLALWASDYGGVADAARYFTVDGDDPEQPKKEVEEEVLPPAPGA